MVPHSVSQDSFFSATSVKTFGHDFVCGSAYIKDGKGGIRFARAVSKAHIRAKLLQTYTHAFVRDLAPHCNLHIEDLLRS